MTKLTKAELSRYQRQIILPGIGIDGQEKLKESRVLVIGAGGLGSPALMYLTAAGVSTIGIVDYDRVDISNLHRQVLYTTDDIGRMKTEAASERLSRMNPGCKIVTHNVRLTRFNIMDIIINYDVVIDGSDNFPTRYLVSDATEILNIPLVFGAVYQYYGQASVFNYKNGPSYRCLFPDQPKPGEVPSCSTAGVLGVMPGIIGSIQAGEAIKIITGVGETLSGRLLQIDTMNYRTDIISFSCDKNYIPAEVLGEYEMECVLPVNLISPEELAREMRNGAAIEIFDIRSSIQFGQFNLGGKNTQPEELMNHPEILPRDRKIVIICEFGDQSFAIVDYLQNNEQFTNVFNLEGGMKNWLSSVD
jgi:sulfur-carrier protein adenylyltransferase/sulfurtransferase